MTVTQSTEPGSTRRAALSAFVGHAIEWYEFAIYGALAAYLALAIFPTGDRTTSLLLTWTVFAVAFLVRPVGGLVLARIADRRGRATGLMLSVLLMSAATAGIGLLPGAAAIGAAAPVLFIALRAVQGFAVGGEMPTAVPYLAESVPADRRHRAMALLAAGTYSASLVGALLAAVLGAALGDEAMRDWGWRIPFLLSIPLGLAAVLVRRGAPESAAFTEAASAAPTPRLRHALRSQRAPILLYLGMAVAYNVAVAVALTGYLSEALLAGIPSSQALWVTVGAYLGLVLSIVMTRRLTRLLGRRGTVLLAAAVTAAAVVPALALARSGSLPATIAGGALAAAAAGLFATPLYLALGDFFAVHVRATAASVAFNTSTAISALVPATTLALRTQLGFDGGLVLWVWISAAVAAIAIAVGWKRVDHVER